MVVAIIIIRLRVIDMEEVLKMNEETLAMLKVLRDVLDKTIELQANLVTTMADSIEVIKKDTGVTP